MEKSDPHLLAIQGGHSVRETLLPYGQQWLDEEDIAAVVDTLRSPFLTQGPAIRRFEESVAAYVGARYAVAFCNGTAALHAACFAAGVGEGDEVITTPMTFAASANCVRYCGGTVVFADVEESTQNIDVYQIASKITPRTKAIIPVDFTGQPVDIDEILFLAKECGAVVIEDAAHALGAEYKGKKVGSIADMTMFSFHPVKHITTGEGGIITTNSKKFYDRLQLFRSHGITREDSLLHKKEEGAWYYEMQELGYNYRITDLQASLGQSQLKKLDSFVSRRLEIAAQYDEAFAGNELLRIPLQKEDRVSSRHLYVIRLVLEKLQVGRKEVIDALLKENIGVNVHYIPVYYHPYYQQLGYPKGVCPHAERFYEEAVTLPLFPKMSNQDVQDVISAVRKVCKHFAIIKD